MYSYNVASAAASAMRGRADWMEQGQTLALAVRITPTTIDPLTGQAAVRCPECWDNLTRQSVVPNDPVCRGAGWVIPASGSTPQQSGYLAAVVFPDAFISANEDRTQWTPQGLLQFSVDMLYWSPDAVLTPKKGDVVVAMGERLARERRYVVADEQSPRALGAAILFYSAELEYRRPDNIIYSLATPSIDTAGLEPGTWG